MQGGVRLAVRVGEATMEGPEIPRVSLISFAISPPAARRGSESKGWITLAMAATTYEYMNPNYKETLDREWWVTSYQLMPDPEYLVKIQNKDPSVTTVDASCRQLQGSRCAPARRAPQGRGTL